MTPQSLNTSSAVQDIFSKLVDLDKSIEVIDAQCRVETESVLSKYDLKKSPLIEERNSFARKIPHFWSIAFKNHPILGTILEDADMDVFEYLSEIVVERDSTSSGEGSPMLINRRIIFHFNPNPYFSNSSLIKEIKESPVDSSSTVINFPIDWKSGTDLSNSMLLSNTIDEQGGAKKRKKEVEGNRPFVPLSTFFAWFSDEDREVADIIANDLYPSAVKYYADESSPAISDEDEVEDEGSFDSFAEETEEDIGDEKDESVEEQNDEDEEDNEES